MDAVFEESVECVVIKAAAQMLKTEVLLKKKDKRGFYKYEYKKIRDRNEVLDCNVYARAASIYNGTENKLFSVDD